jgi:hypothetical protein
MIKLALYAYGFYWALGKMGYGISKNKPVQGYGEAHDPFEHPLGEYTCQSCPHHHPDLAKRIEAIERDHQQY